MPRFNFEKFPLLELYCLMHTKTKQHQIAFLLNIFPHFSSFPTTVLKFSLYATENDNSNFLYIIHPQNLGLRSCTNGLILSASTWGGSCYISVHEHNISHCQLRKNFCPVPQCTFLGNSPVRQVTGLCVIVMYWNVSPGGWGHEREWRLMDYWEMGERLVVDFRRNWGRSC